MLASRSMSFAIKVARLYVANRRANPIVRASTSRTSLANASSDAEPPVSTICFASLFLVKATNLSLLLS